MGRCVVAWVIVGCCLASALHAAMIRGGDPSPNSQQDPPEAAWQNLEDTLNDQPSVPATEDPTSASSQPDASGTMANAAAGSSWIPAPLQNLLPWSTSSAATSTSTVADENNNNSDNTDISPADDSGNDADAEERKSDTTKTGPPQPLVIDLESLPSAEAPHDLNGQVAEEGVPLKYPYINKKLPIPLLDGKLIPKLDPEEGVMEINTEFDPMKPRSISFWGEPDKVLFLGETRTRRFGASYHGHLGPLQPGDQGTKLYQAGTSNVSPLSQTAMDLGEPFDTRPTVVTTITQAKLLSPNVRHRFVPGYLLSGLCADKATGLPKPCLSMATTSAAPSKLEADRLGYDPFGVNNPPFWARKKIISPPDLMH